jgi:fused signal recognition particle receptor
LEELETLLLVADVGIEVTDSIIQELTDQVKRNQLQDGAALHTALKTLLQAKLQPCEMPLLPESENSPYVILVVGVNGVGKTTTIGKIANRLKHEGKSVLLAAGDTFRAAAVEQLQAWGERNEVPVVAQHTGADSASVIFDAVQAAQSRGIDVVIADTAGRLHNKSNLMEELEKVKRVAGKLDSQAPHEVLLVLDAGTGQNAVAQMTQFNSSVGISGIALTKLDGTAKGGVIFALAQQFSTPIRYIGVGEGQDDLQPFVASDFIEALMGYEQG